MIVLPVFLIFLTGYIGQKILKFDIKTISTVALYLMSPFLAFKTFYVNELNMDYFYIVIFCLLLMLFLFVIVWVTAYVMKASQSERSAMLLGGVFMNSGNYGAPVVLFAFDVIAFDYAIILMVFQSLLMNTFGVFFASIGGDEKATLKQSLMSAARMPVTYAAFAGIAFQLLSITIPNTLMEGISLIADASIPTVMLVLGMQLAVITRKKVAYRYVTAVTFIRMIASPIVAIIILFFLPVSDLLKAVMILQAAMPAAANTTMFALQFGTEPDLVSFTTFITTIISLFTIPVVLFYLGV